MVTRVDDTAPAVAVPRLNTARLLLRELRRGDFDAFAAHTADAEAQQHLGGVVDRRTAWRIFAASTGYWLIDGVGWWAVERRDTGEVAGMVGAFFRDSGPDLEIGWSLYRRFWGQGFATEAAQAALDFGLARFERTRAIALIDATNAPSIAVSRRLGMRYETDMELFGKMTGRYALERIT